MASEQPEPDCNTPQDLTSIAALSIMEMRSLRRRIKLVEAKLDAVLELLRKLKSEGPS
jgi:hypothetical protein